MRDMIATMHRMNIALYTDELRMREMVERALSESWQVVHHHLERKNALFLRVVEEGVSAGEFTSPDPVVAARCVQVALIRFCHPTLLVQCAGDPGPSLDQMTEFVLAGLGYRSCSADGRHRPEKRGQDRH